MKSATWKTVRKGGRLVLRSPDGRYIEGTPAEVRAAGLLPWQRDSLADSLKMVRYMAARFNFTEEERRESLKLKRRDAVRFASHDRALGCMGRIPVALEVLFRAAARYMGRTPSEFALEFAISAIASVHEQARGDGLRTISLTKYERMALDVLGFSGVVQVMEKAEPWEIIKIENALENYTRALSAEKKSADFDDKPLGGCGDRDATSDTNGTGDDNDE